jgi:uncharacterized membrane protein
MTTRWSVRTAFTREALRNIEQAIRETEAAHEGQIRFVVEHALDFAHLIAGVSARQRAIDVFSQLRVWDTEHNNGVLLYLLLADRDVEIVADRAIHNRVSGGWEPICRRMEERFRAGEFEVGVIEGIRAIGEHLQEHFPTSGRGPNELPDAPVVI